MKRALLALPLLILPFTGCTSLKEAANDATREDKNITTDQMVNKVLREDYNTKIIVKDYFGTRCYITVNSYENTSTGISCIRYQN